MMLEITTVIGCKNMCVYCPQKILLESYKGDRTSLSFDNFKKLMINVPKDVVISFTGFSESFLNSDSSKMMKYVIDEGYEVILYTTLIGFNDNDLKILSECTLPFTATNFHRFDGNGYDEYEFNRKMKLFKSNVKSKYYSDGRLRDIWSRAGTVKDEPIKKGKFFCGTFSNNVVLPNGDVYICCMDYGLKHCIGNLYKTNFMSLDRQKLIDMSDMEDSDIICRKCLFFKNK